MISTGEIYRLLKASPSTNKALRLAARLRRAARDGRALKDGRLISAESVDEAMDTLLEMQQREKQARRQSREKRQEQEAQWRKERGEEEVNPRIRRRQSQRQVQEEEEEVEPLPGEEWMPAPSLDDELEVQGVRDMPLPDREDVKERMRRINISDVPEEVMEGIINSKFNYVDRVWRAPDSSTLPRVPDGDDSSIPQESWLRLPHVAVNGMTNTGKSTLINHCLRWEYAAKASSKPGRTESIDFYLVNNRFVLVDLPGYPDPDKIAYMGVTKQWETHWEDLVLTYLEMCGSGHYDLRLLLQLQPSQMRPSRMCTRFAAESERLSLPSLLVMTKDDQFRDHEQRIYWATQIRRSLHTQGPHIHYTSNTELPTSRKCRKQVHRFICSAVRAGSTREAREMLRTAWQDKDVQAINTKPPPAKRLTRRMRVELERIKKKKEKKEEKKEKKALKKARVPPSL